MPFKNVLLVVGLFLIISIKSSAVSSSSDFENLSYGRDVLYGGNESVSEVTTKKPGFFGNLKKIFVRGGSSTTESIDVLSNTPVIATKPTASSSIIVQAPLTRKIPSNPSNHDISLSTRDYTNPNIKPGLNQPYQQGSNYNLNLNNGQMTSGRDYINPNIRPNNLPTRPDGQINQVINPSNSNRRDYVNPNIRPNILPARSDGHLNENAMSIPTNQGNNNQPTTTSSKRDYVNSNFDTRGSRPSITHPIPINPGLPTKTTPKFDYVNTNIPTPRPPAVLPHNAAATVFNANDFPKLGPPRGSSQGSDIHVSATTPNKKHEPSRNFGNNNNFDVRRQPPTNNNQNSLATDTEIISFSEALFSKDINNQNRFITLNLQGKTRSSDRTDEAQNKLMEINEQALVTPTIAKMRLLFDNYELDTMTNEYVAPIERNEESDFLDVVMSTSVMKHAMLFLQQKGLITPDPEKHRDLIRTIWFTLYSRGKGKIGSSAFEHVFLSEIKNGTVIGLHNWVYYYEQEKAGNIDYKGYIKKIDLGNKGSIIKFRFDHNGVQKPVNALFVGTSPELEMALYTVCFQLRADKDCPVAMAGTRFNIITHTWRYRGKSLIGSAYPEI